MKLRTLPSVPQEGVNIGYVNSAAHEVGQGLRFLDTSRETLQNRVILMDRLVDDQTVIPTDDILCSNVSKRDLKQVLPVPLYYSYVVGRGNYRLYIPGFDSADPNATRLLAKQAVRIVTYEGVDATLEWDISIVYVSADDSYIATIYTDRRSTPDQVLWVQYEGIDVNTGARVRGLKEVMNLTPISTKVTVTNATSPVRYVANTNGETCPAIAFFGGAGAPTITVTSTTLSIASSPTRNIPIGPLRPIKSVVAEINSYQIENCTARVLNDAPHSLLLATSLAPTVDGNQLNFATGWMRLKFGENAVIRAEKPWRDSIAAPWYPRVNPGAVTLNWDVVDTTSGTSANTGVVQYVVPGYTGQAFYPTFPYRSIVGETPVFVDEKAFRLARSPIRSVDHVDVRYKGNQRNSLIRDIDLNTATVYLNQRVQNTQDVTVDYQYEELWQNYTGVDLNVLPAHSDELLDKYVGLYLLPTKAEIVINDAGATISGEFQHPVRHVVGTTYQDVLDRINTQTTYQINESGYNNTVYVPTLTLGVFRTVQNRDVEESVDLADARLRGGGLRDGNVYDRAAPEGQMNWDDGYWDGARFPAGGLLIVDHPDIRRTEYNGLTGNAPDVYDPLTGLVWQNPTGRLFDDELDTIAHMNAAAGSLILREVDIVYPTTGTTGLGC